MSGQNYKLESEASRTTGQKGGKRTFAAERIIRMETGATPLT